MELITFLILFPFAAAIVLAFMKKQAAARDVVIYLSCALIVVADLAYAVTALSGGKDVSFVAESRAADSAILLGEIFLMALVFYYGFRYKKYYVALLSAVQTIPVAWMELSGRSVVSGDHIFSDRLTVVMCLIVGIVGCLICVYAVGYMKEYHAHHTEYKDRRAFFFPMLFVFLGAMFGLVFSANLTWMYFFWEITSICSFLLIGYNRSHEATENSFRALWMNLLGGVGFAAAILYCEMNLGFSNLADFVKRAGDPVLVFPVILLAFAALTKSAQMPFSRWLLGAMVAPTPTSALLHSATMVKAGVYLLIRLSPAMSGNAAGMMVTAVGGFTFFATSLLAISQSDGKKVLAYSTVSNLGLIAACAGVGIHEAVWAAILLMMFHAVSKSLMFLSVGAVENRTGSRNIEDMHGLIVKLPGLAFVMMIGIAGMFLAPFGMLISKWAALRAFVDSKNVLLVAFLVFGSATTLFYWAKWLGKLVAVIHRSQRLPNKTKSCEWFSLITEAVLVVALCVLFPLVSVGLVEPFLMGMFRSPMPTVISTSDINAMIMMLIIIIVLPVVVRLLAWGRQNQVSLSYMGGINEGDDRGFVDSFGEEKPVYLANWYMGDYFGEKKLLKPVQYIASAAIIVCLAVATGGII